jgi:hypothetical protein
MTVCIFFKSLSTFHSGLYTVFPDIMHGVNVTFICTGKPKVSDLLCFNARVASVFALLQMLEISKVRSHCMGS